VRYLTLRLRPTDGGAFHPVGERLARDPSIRREAIHHVELLADGTVLTLAEGSGDRERYEELMSTAPEVEDFLVSGSERWMATSQFEARAPVRQLLEWRRGSDLVVEMPIDINDDGSLRVTFIGTDSDFSALYEYTTESAEFDGEVVETGTYDPDRDSLVRVLTSRQQEILRAAVAVGYYSNPREANHKIVAEEVGIAPSTAGDHLRAIEARIFDTLVR
jgi:hypothetical protein